MAIDHVSRSFDKELESLHRQVLKMGRLVQSQLEVSLEAFGNRDSELARQVIESDVEVNRVQHELDRLVVRMLALRQPVGVDLRTIVSALKIGSELERIADYAAGIIKHLGDLDTFPLGDTMEVVARMVRIAQEMLKEAMEAYNESSVDLGLEVMKKDDMIDARYAELLELLRKHMREDPDYVEPCTTLIFAGRGVERMGDHITNIAEHVYYLVRGESYPAGQSISQ